MAAVYRSAKHVLLQQRLMTIVVALCSMSFTATSARPWNIMSPLEYYVQVGLGAPDLGLLIPPINRTLTNNFGQTQLFTFNVTQGPDAASLPLGFMRGYTVQASYLPGDVHGVEVEVLSYNDGSLNGTISLQGLINAGTNEIALVGGTGDFRGARGYGIVTLLSSSATLALYHHNLYFL